MNKYHIVSTERSGNSQTVLEFDEHLTYKRALVGYSNDRLGTYKLYDPNYHGYGQKYVKEIGLIDLIPWAHLPKITGVPASYIPYFENKGIKVGAGYA